MPTYAVPLTLVIAAIDPTFDGTPQEFAELIGANATLSSTENFALVIYSETEPTSNLGLWFDRVNNTFKRWDDDEGGYVPISFTQQSLGYAVQAAEPDPDAITMWVVLNGSGYPIDLRTYADGAWRSMLGGASADAGRIPVSAGSGLPPVWRYAGYRIGDVKHTWRSADAGWVAFGSTLSRTIYAELYQVLLDSGAIDSSSGDGSTTFVIPELAGRVIVAAGAGTGLTVRAVGASGGAESVTLSLPSVGTPGGAASGGDLTAFSGQTGLNATSLMQPFRVLNAYVYTGVET